MSIAFYGLESQNALKKDGEDIKEKVITYPADREPI